MVTGMQFPNNVKHKGSESRGSPCRQVQSRILLRLNVSNTRDDAGGEEAVSKKGRGRTKGQKTSRIIKLDPLVNINFPCPTVHRGTFQEVGIPIKTYPYISRETNIVDFRAMCITIQEALNKSVVVLYGCGCNATDINPTERQWKELSHIIWAKQHFPIFVCTSESLASTHRELDALGPSSSLSKALDLALLTLLSKTWVCLRRKCGLSTL